MSKTLLAGIVVFALALVLRLLFVGEYHRDLGLDIRALEQTDNHTFSEWARGIAEGDLLCEEPVHAFHLWTADVAPESRWLSWYGDPKTYHQSPLYAYFVAAVYSLLGDGHAAFSVVQAILGALTCLLTFVLVRRCVSLFAAVCAGTLLALCSPYFFYDAILLRDGPLALLTIIVALALERAATRGTTFAWLKAGAALGLFTLGKETGPALLALTLVGVAVAYRADRARVLRAAAAVLAGWFVLSSPALLRNVAVGAPAFKMSTRGPEVYVSGNALLQEGVHWDPPSKDMRAILVETEFSLAKSMAATLATHKADPLGFVRLQWDKLRAFFNGYEVPNNVNWYLARAHLDTLGVGFVRLSWLSPLAILGFFLALGRPKRLLIPMLLFVALAGSVVALYVIARFRLHVFPLFAVFAGFALDWLRCASQDRRFGRLLVAALALLVLFQWCRPDEKHKIGGGHQYSIPMHKQLVAQNFPEARRWLERYRVDAEEAGRLPFKPKTVETFDTLEEAFAEFARSEALPADSAERQLAIGRGYAKLVSITRFGLQHQLVELARSCFDKALQIDPGVAGAHYGMGLVEAARRYKEEALHHFALELEVNPDHLETLREVGDLFHIKKELLDALVYYELAIAAGDERPRTIVRSALILVDPRHQEMQVPLPGGRWKPAHDLTTAFARARWAVDKVEDDPELLEPMARVFYAVGMKRGEKALVDDAIGYLRRLLDEFRPLSQSLPNIIRGFENVRDRRWPPKGE